MSIRIFSNGESPFNKQIVSNIFPLSEGSSESLYMSSIGLTALNNKRTTRSK